MNKDISLINSEDFTNKLLSFWLNNEEINRIMESTRDGDNEFFKEGFKFGLIWAGILAGTLPHYAFKLEIK